MSCAVYLFNILKNHTVHACEGDTLTIECPSKTSVSVLSAFYGRRVPNQHLCPAANSNQTAEEDNECASPVAVEVYTQSQVKIQTNKSTKTATTKRVTQLDYCGSFTNYASSSKCVFSTVCRKFCQSVRTSAPATSLSSVQCLDRTLVLSPPSTFLLPTSADRVCWCSATINHLLCLPTFPVSLPQY